MTSLSVIPPTPWWITLTRTSGWSIFASSEMAASTEPPTSPLRIRFRSWTAPACSCEKSVSSETPPFERCASCSARSRWPRRCASVARLALVLDDARELARGRRLVEAEDLDRVAGPASLTFSPR